MVDSSLRPNSMGLRKRCSRDEPPTLKAGEPNPLFCPASPRCDHYWHYDFRVNGRRYRASTDTADKHRARDIEAKERTRILEGRHGIRRQPDLTFREFAETYLRDHARLNKRRPERDRQIIASLNRTFGSVLLHEITPHRIEQWKRDRLAGRWRAYGQRSASKRVKPATVNRELDVLRSILSKAVEWRKLLENPCRLVKRLKVENRRTRILDEPEQVALIAAFENRTPGRPQSLQRLKMQTLVQLALVTGARLGELLELAWDQCNDGFVTFLETKNGRIRQIPLSPAVEAILRRLPRVCFHVFTNPATGKPYTSSGVRHIFNRALVRAGIRTGDVTFHTLRHTALSRMIAAGHSDHTVRAISGHSSTRMLERYTHPTDRLKLGALESGAFLVTKWSQSGRGPADGPTELTEFDGLLRKLGGRREARTRDLRVANAALSQLS